MIWWWSMKRPPTLLAIRSSRIRRSSHLWQPRSRIVFWRHGVVRSQKEHICHICPMHYGPWAVPGFCFQYMQDWKKTQGLMIMKPQFTASADFSGITEPKRPSLKLCSMTEGGNLEIPRPIRDKFLSDPIRSHLDYCSEIDSLYWFSSIYSLYINNLVVLFRSSAVRISDPDWRVRLANFDNVFKPSSQGEAPAPKPGAENADLSVEGANANATTQGSNSGAGKASEPPPSMSQEDFQKAYPEPTLTISLTVAGGQSITCTYAKGKVFLSSQSSMVVGGIDSSGSKPVLCYAGGSWISDSSKVRLFKLCFGMFMYVFIRLYALFLCWICLLRHVTNYLGKSGNENKAIEFRVESSDQRVSDIICFKCVFALGGWHILVSIFKIPDVEVVQC